MSSSLYAIEDLPTPRKQWLIVANLMFVACIVAFLVLLGTSSDLFRAMTMSSCCAFAGFMFNSNKEDCLSRKEEGGKRKKGGFCGWESNLRLMVDLQKRIMAFRDIIELPPCRNYETIDELVITTIQDLQKSYPGDIATTIQTSEMNRKSIDQVMIVFYDSLSSLQNSWMKNYNKPDIFKSDTNDLNSEQIVEVVMTIIDHMIKVATDRFNKVYEDNQRMSQSLRAYNTFGKTFMDPYLDMNSPVVSSSITPTSVLDFMELEDNSDAKLSKVVKKLSPDDVHRLSFHIPSNTDQINITDECSYSKNIVVSSTKEVTNEKITLDCVTDNENEKRPETTIQIHQNVKEITSVSLPPPIKSAIVLKALPVGSSPPPPPLGAGRSLRAKKASGKLKRSTQLGNLYRVLKVKIEGSSLKSKSSNGRKGIGSSSVGGKQGMADALKEMTKRSVYFQQIEEDVQKYGKMINELKTMITAFQTSDMKQLISFRKQVESQLEKLTDETQVLVRFEGFPAKKLEALRTAASVYSKFDAIHNDLKSWKVEAPLGTLLDKVENYFTKVKRELDAFDRTKDEESRKFHSQNITFDFQIVMQIKESMVDVSSSCMELALKERREAKGKQVSAKMLWRAFQFAFRVYTFAGGFDDRADELTKELAEEIERAPQN